MTALPISVQLYTVRGVIQNDTPGTLRQLRDIGYLEAGAFVKVENSRGREYLILGLLLIRQHTQPLENDLACKLHVERFARPYTRGAPVIPSRCASPKRGRRQGTARICKVGAVEEIEHFGSQL